ncbi:MAG: hypothetical protein WD768_02025 [Phycisphaeraceae bacterium]
MPDPKPKRTWLRLTMGALTLLVVAVALAAWWLSGSKVWTDDKTIRVADAQATLREVLWTQPLKIEDAFKVEEAINTEADEFEPAISPDGSELYFVRGLPSHDGGQKSNIVVSYRRNNRWTKPQLLEGINSAFNDLGPRLSGDGEKLYFYSDRTGGEGGFDIWMATRTADGWGEPVNLGPNINSEHNDFNPAPTPDGKRLFFATNRVAAAKSKRDQRWSGTIRHSPEATDYDIFVAEEKGQGPGARGQGKESKTAEKHKSTKENGAAGSRDNPQSAIRNPRSSDLFLPAVAVARLNTPFHEGACAITPSGDFLYFASNRDGDERGYDLYRCRLRLANTGDTGTDIAAGLRFGEIERIKEISTTSDEVDPSLTMEGFRMLLSSDMPNGAGGYDIYVSDSREVFADRDAREMPHLGWSWWALIAATLLLLLLLFLLRGMDSQKLSILQICIIASLFIHLLFIIALSFVFLSQEVIEHIQKKEEVRVVVNLQAATEMKLRSTARSQQADLPMQAPTMEQSQKVVQENTMQRPTPRTEALNIPSARAEPAPNSMILPEASKQASKPNEAVPVERPQFEPTELQVDPQLREVEQVQQAQSQEQPATAAPNDASRQETKQADTAAQTPQVNVAKAQATDASMAQAAQANRPTATAEAVKSQPASPQPAVNAPTPSPQFDTQRVEANQPAAPTLADSGSAAPKRAVAESSSPAETAPAQAKPSQQAPQSFASAAQTNAPQSSKAESVAATAPAPAGVQPTISAQVQTQAVSSEAPQGPKIPENTPHVAQRSASAPSGKAAEMKIETPPAQTAAESLESGAALSFAKPNVEVIQITHALPIEQAALDAQPSPSAKVTSAQVTPAPQAAETSRTLAERVETKASATSAASTESGSAAAAPSQPDEASMASSAGLARSEASRAEEIKSSVMSPSAVTPSNVDPSISASTVQADALAQERPSDARPTTAKVAPQATQSASAEVATSSSSALATTKNTPTESLAQAQTAATQTSRSTVDKVPNLNAPPSFAPPSVDAPLFDAAQTARVSADSKAPPSQVAADKAATTSKASTGAAVSESIATVAMIDPLAVNDNDLTSLLNTQSSTDLRARSDAAPVSDAASALLSPVIGKLGPDDLAQPLPLFQRAPDARKKLLKEMGGTPESEDAVERALAYLARNQEPDGRWTKAVQGDKGPGKRGDNQHDMALTGLPVLAFLASDHTSAKAGPYRETVTAGIDFLIKHQKKDGDLRGEGSMYDHCIATIALAEAALMTNDSRQREAALLAARFIVKGQDTGSGGWRYRPGEHGDTSVVGWAVMALHSCERLGFETDQKLSKGINKWMDIVTRKGSLLAGYQNASAKPAMTAEAVFCRILLGEKFAEKPLKEYNEYIWENRPGRGDRDYYLWYYATLSASQINDGNWEKWNQVMRENLIKLQKKDGKDDGCFPMQFRWDDSGGTIYTTSMAALTLEVYYRYLPMYKGEKDSGPRR